MTTGPTFEDCCPQREGTASIINAENMVDILRTKYGDHGFCCPLIGMYPCEKNLRGCDCHERYLAQADGRS